MIDPALLADDFAPQGIFCDSGDIFGCQHLEACATGISCIKVRVLFTSSYNAQDYILQ